ncbi:MAG: anion permease [Candidatus Rokubacteria bacterium]|nr:anion permease [Candidatus Rokubacteria bacterium]
MPIEPGGPGEPAAVPTPSALSAADYAALLARVDLFSGLDRLRLARLAAHLELCRFQDGGVLCRQDDPGDALYVVVRGQLGVFKQGTDGAGALRLATARAGDPIGEMALLTGEPRSATVRAEGPVEAVRLERARFLDLVGDDPTVVLAMAATVSRRLAAANRLVLAAHQAGALAESEPARTALRIDATAVELPRRRARRVAITWRPLIGVALAAAALAAGWLTPSPADLPVRGWHALWTLVALVAVLAFEALPDGVVALTLASIWVIGGVTLPAVAVSGFTSTAWALQVATLAVGAAVSASGLLYRFALWSVRRVPGTYAGQAIALCLAGVLIGPAMPNATGRVALLAPAVGELIEALGYRLGTRAATGLAMAVLVGFGQTVAAFLTSSSTTLLVYALMPETTRASLTWTVWGLRAAPTTAILLATFLVALLWLYRPSATAPRPSRTDRRERLAVQQALLGRPSPGEKVTLAVTIVLLAGFASQPWHGIDPAWLAALALGVLGVAGVLQKKVFRAIDWDFLLLFGILASMARVFETTGLDRWLTAMVKGIAGPLAHTPLLFVGALAILSVGVTLVLRWQAAAPLLVLAMMPFARAAGIDPWVVAMTTLMACSTFLTPYQNTQYLALYHGAEPHIFTHRQARRGALAFAIATLVALLASVPLWRWMGLM